MMRRPRPPLMLAALLLAAAPAAAQSAGQSAARPAPEADGREDKVERILTQPARDVGLTRREIAEALRKARANPYDMTGMRTCRAIDTEVQALTAVLGPDFDAAGKDNQDVAENLATAGAEGVVNSLIPFRGLIREVTGAANQDRRYQAAVIAGSARRGFLKGVARQRGCRLTPYAAPAAAEKPAERGQK